MGYWKDITCNAGRELVFSIPDKFSIWGSCVWTGGERIINSYVRVDAPDGMRMGAKIESDVWLDMAAGQSFALGWDDGEYVGNQRIIEGQVMHWSGLWTFTVAVGLAGGLSTDGKGGWVTAQVRPTAMIPPL